MSGAAARGRDTRPAALSGGAESGPGGVAAPQRRRSGRTYHARKVMKNISFPSAAPMEKMACRSGFVGLRETGGCARAR